MNKNDSTGTCDHAESGRPWIGREVMANIRPHVWKSYLTLISSEKHLRAFCTHLSAHSNNVTLRKQQMEQYIVANKPTNTETNTA